MQKQIKRSLDFYSWDELELYSNRFEVYCKIARRILVLCNHNINNSKNNYKLDLQLFTLRGNIYSYNPIDLTTNE